MLFRRLHFALRCFTFCHESSSVLAQPEFTSWKAWGQSWKSFKQWAVDKWSTEAELPLPTDKLPAPLLSIQALALHSLLIVICLCLMFTASLRKCGRCEQNHVKAQGYSETLPLLVARRWDRTYCTLCMSDRLFPAQTLFLSFVGYFFSPYIFLLLFFRFIFQEGILARRL